MWNTDGFSIFKSSNYEIWSLFMSINELPPNLRYKRENMLLGGLWFGREKPNPNLFLEPLANELNHLKQGIKFDIVDVEHPVLFKGGIVAGTCDTPAKAVFLCCKNFNGLFGCPKCLCRGEKSDRTKQIFVYPFQENLQLRTEQNYLHHLDQLRQLRGQNPSVEAHMGIKGPTILKNMLLAPLVSSTSIDVMHSVFIGVVKTLMSLYFDKLYDDEPYNFIERMDVVSDILCKIKPPPFLPIFSLVMRQPYFNHFKLLYLGVSLLCQNSVTEADLVLSQCLLDCFVKQYQTIFGLSKMTFNLHALRHLPGVVRDLGPLWTTSCFVFENLNGALKYLIHGTQFVGLQVQTNFELLALLPTLIDKLSNTKVKDFCTKMTSPSARLRITESLGNNIYVIGPMVKTGPTCTFKLLKVNSVLFVSASEKVTKKDSSFVSYKCNDIKNRSIITTFENVTECQCSSLCACPGEYFAVINRVNCSVAFQTLEPVYDVFNTFIYTNSDIIDRVPINSLIGLCVNVLVENKCYITDFINKNYNQ
ncbi:hypothetical protein FOCC_FOCC006569 [Frankliniella occidentalis]|nr:hypothetical protein FOCC_FOCC006569 [Frankliniella occidentalis]